MQHLRELIELGFAPMMALVIVAVIVLWLALCGVIVAVWRHSINAARKREIDRKEQIDEINGRLQKSEDRHEKCDEDRGVLHDEVGDLREEIARLKGCPHRTCPMRLPR